MKPTRRTDISTRRCCDRTNRGSAGNSWEDSSLPHTVSIVELVAPIKLTRAPETLPEGKVILIVIFFGCSSSPCFELQRRVWSRR